MSYLIFVHIGPVQEFIAAARRTRDLWYGSWMLSELAKAVALAIAEGDPKSLIFPAVSSLEELKPGSALDAPNKIVAEIASAPSTVAQNAKNALCTRLHQLRDDALKDVEGYRIDEASQQIDDLPQFYWVAVPRSTDYVADRRSGEQLLAARKNTREYRQPLWASSQPKSSLDGKLESVINETAYAPPNATQEEKRRRSKQLYKKYRISGAERLSGVDLVKRLGDRGTLQGEDSKGTEFPSTSHIAALPAAIWLAKHYPDAWNTLVWSLGTEVIDRSLLKKRYDFGTEEQVRVDASILFEGRLREFAEEIEAPEDKLISALRDFQKSVDDSSKIPIPYYAILVGDGDNMGVALSRLTSADEHRAFSETLSEFAGEVESKIREHKGATVYAGGDDVLALLPLHTAIEAAADVAALFRDKLEDYDVTFSAGISIAHFMEPLSDTLDLAREAEKDAKDYEDKNALAITVSKRSGADRTVVGHWGDLDETLLKLVELHRKEDIPDGVAYQIQEVVMELGGPTALQGDGTHPTALRGVVNLEAQRLLNRKRAQRGQMMLDKEVKDLLGRELQGDGGVMRLVRLLIVSKLIADAKDQAGAPITEVPQEASND